MPDNVTKDLCDQRSGAILASLCRIENVLGGNGRPGLRETQAEVERVKESMQAMRSCMEKKSIQNTNWFMFFVRPLLPLIYGAVFAWLLFYLNSG